MALIAGFGEGGARGWEGVAEVGDARGELRASEAGVAEVIGAAGGTEDVKVAALASGSVAGRTGVVSGGAEGGVHLNVPCDRPALDRAWRQA